ncbi:hypothetical protein BJ165DRAFT_1535458 [Panaeolus papilionaceus]|nr:hypothetical protein BJ165DRAFT_1535458 [Panaeolus papilionaceus]
MDTLSLNLRHLFLSFSEPGQAAIVVNFYKQCASTSGVAAFAELTSLNYVFVDRSDVSAFNEILRGIPPFVSLCLFAQQSTQHVFPMDIIDLPDYFDHPARPLTSLFI